MSILWALLLSTYPKEKTLLERGAKIVSKYKLLRYICFLVLFGAPWVEVIHPMCPLDTWQPSLPPRMGAPPTVSPAVPSNYSSPSLSIKSPKNHPDPRARQWVWYNIEDKKHVESRMPVPVAPFLLALSYHTHINLRNVCMCVCLSVC